MKLRDISIELDAANSLSSINMIIIENERFRKKPRGLSFYSLTEYTRYWVYNNSERYYIDIIQLQRRQTPVYSYCDTAIGHLMHDIIIEFARPRIASPDPDQLLAIISGGYLLGWVIFLCGWTKFYRRKIVSGTEFSWGFSPNYQGHLYLNRTGWGEWDCAHRLYLTESFDLCNTLHHGRKVMWWRQIKFKLWTNERAAILSCSLGVVASFRRLQNSPITTGISHQNEW